MLDILIPDRVYIDWNKKKCVRKGLSKGTHYATYYDTCGKEFFVWMTRKDMKRYKKLALEIDQYLGKMQENFHLKYTLLPLGQMEQRKDI